jgi:outer membrane protein assembly factor BamA
MFIRAQFESGGTSLNFIDPSIITQQNLQFFQYLRASFDFRQVRTISKWAILAYRFNTGVAYSYGSESERSLPYEKFFFVGGSNSVRAWRPRRLGLGSVPPANSKNFTPDDDGTYDYPLEKPGEVLVEGSVELRSKLVGFIDGAIFVDAGNVWAFQKPSTEIVGNSQFKPNTFYKELGVGTGFGLRFDFTFLILRFDIGIKVYDPARIPSQRFVLDDVRFFKPYATKVGEDSENHPIYKNIKEPVIYNVGIGFPF